MTFAQALHRVLDHYFGDEATERRDRKRVEKIEERLREKVYAEVWDEVFTGVCTEIPEELQLRVTDDGREKIRQRFLDRRRAELTFPN